MTTAQDRLLNKVRESLPNRAKALQYVAMYMYFHVEGSNEDKYDCMEDDFYDYSQYSSVELENSRGFERATERLYRYMIGDGFEDLANEIKAII